MNPRSLLVSLALAATALASAQSPRSIAQGLADEEAKANLKGDVAWYRAHLAPEYVETGAKGEKADKAATIARFQAALKAGKPSKMTARTVKAEMKDGRLATTTRVDMAGTMRVGDGKPHRVEYHVTADAVWTKRGGAWTKLSERSYAESGKLDGRAF